MAYRSSYGVATETRSVRPFFHIGGWFPRGIVHWLKSRFISFSVLPWQLAFITSLSFILYGLAINGIQVILWGCHGDTECKALFPYRWMVSAWDCALVEVSLYFIFRASVAIGLHYLVEFYTLRPCHQWHTGHPMGLPRRHGV